MLDAMPDGVSKIGKHSPLRQKQGEKENGKKEMRFLKYSAYYAALALLLSSGGCGGRKSEFRSGILQHGDRTIAWYTNKHEIGFVLSLPKATSVSDSLVTTKKNIALVQKITTIDGKKYDISSANELKDGITRLLINGKLFDNLHGVYIVENNGKLVVEKKIPADIAAAVLKASHETPYPAPSDPLFWLALGFVAQLLFTSRMIVQWYSSEKAKKSVMPVLFWYLSVIGSTLLLTYAIYRQDPVFILGQSAGLLVYFRNLYLIWREKKHKEETKKEESAKT